MADEPTREEHMRAQQLVHETLLLALWESMFMEHDAPEALLEGMAEVTGRQIDDFIKRLGGRDRDITGPLASDRLYAFWGEIAHRLASRRRPAGGSSTG